MTNPVEYMSNPAAQRLPTQALAIIGDRDPISFGGGIVWAPGDKGGEHGMLEMIQEPSEEETDYDRPSGYKASARWEISRISLDPEVPSWVDLKSVAATNGLDPDELRALFTDPNPVVRAEAYYNLISHYGAHEFDQYPLEWTFAEVTRHIEPTIRAMRRHGRL